jgi:ABC-2 type transport system ATP-binding protein
VLGEKAALDGDALVAAVPRAEAPAAIRALVEAGVDIEEARWIGADLEDVFMTETGWTGVQGTPAKGTDHAG